MFSLSFCERITFNDGSSVSSSITSYIDSLFLLESGDVYRKNDIEDILFIEQGDFFTDEEPSYWDLGTIKENVRMSNPRFLNAGGLIILDEGTDILHSDSTRSYQYHFIGKILKPDNLDWGESSLYFEEGRSRVKILGARNIKPDGTVHLLESNNVKIVVPVEGLVHMGREKYLAFSLPDVQVGDIIEYVYKREEYNPYDKSIFEPSFHFQSSEPVVISRFVVEIPDGLELNHYSRNIPGPFYEKSVSTIGDAKRYIWELRNVQPLVEEDYMPGYIDVAPGIYTTLFKNWDYLYDWESSMTLRRMEVTPEIEQMVQKLTNHKEQIEDKIAALYHWIQRNIRYVSIKGGIATGMCGHAAGITLENKFGDCIDKSTLFSTMLKVIGVEAYPVGLLTNDDGSPPWNIPNIYCNHAITEVHLGDSTFYLDPTSSDHRFPYFNGNDHGTLVINSILREIHQTPIPPPSANMRKYIINVKLEENGEAFVEYKSNYTGDWEAWIRGFWAGIPEAEWEDQINNMISEDYPSTELIEYAIENPDDLDKQFGLSWKYKIDELPFFAKDLVIFRIPDLRRYTFDEVTYQDRNFDIVYETSYCVSHSAEVKIPQGFTVKYIPSKVSLNSPYGSYFAEYRVKNNTIFFDDSYERTKRIVPVNDYENYKDFLNKITEYSRNRIILQRNI